jgi:hypothetical protein
MIIPVAAKQMLLAEAKTLGHFYLKCRAIQERTFGYLIKNTESWQC